MSTWPSAVTSNGCDVIDCSQPSLQGARVWRLSEPYSYEHELSTGFGQEYLRQQCTIGFREDVIAAVWSSIYSD